MVNGLSTGKIGKGAGCGWWVVFFIPHGPGVSGGNVLLQAEE